VYHRDLKVKPNLLFYDLSIINYGLSSADKWHIYS
jgi:hypothetical protein